MLTLSGGMLTISYFVICRVLKWIRSPCSTEQLLKGSFLLGFFACHAQSIALCRDYSNTLLLFPQTFYKNDNQVMVTDTVEHMVKWGGISLVSSG